ncbi:MAG: hypothetical protein ACC630_04835 [Nitrospinota bacterium]
MNTIYIECPCCKEIIEIDSKSGKVTSHFKKKFIKGSADKVFKNSIKELKTEKSLAEERFRDLQEKQKHRKADLERLFGKERENIRKIHDFDKPLKDIDLD